VALRGSPGASGFGHRRLRSGPQWWGRRLPSSAHLLIGGALLEAAAGLPLLLAPASAASLFTAEPPAAPALGRARLLGAALLALALACGHASLAPTAAPAIAIAWIDGAYNLLASCVLLLAAALPPVRRPAAVAGARLHGLLAAAQLTAHLNRSCAAPL
jgi:hypothetical protein